jgi:hypothetical protein
MFSKEQERENQLRTNYFEKILEEEPKREKHNQLVNKGCNRDFSFDLTSQNIFKGILFYVLNLFIKIREIRYQNKIKMMIDYYKAHVKLYNI